MQSKNIVMTIIAASLFGAVSSASLIRLTGNNSVDTDGNPNTLEQRLAELESQLSQEQQARLQLERIVAQQTKSNPGRSQVELSAQAIDDVPEEILDNTQTEILNESLPPEIQASRRLTDYRKQALIKGGFSEDEISTIFDNESEVSLQILNDRYNARRAALQEATGNNSQRLSAQELLRERLGDDQFERYRKANGLPTSVSVNNVLSKSPGENAGILPGDKIISYNNKRVFDVRELNKLTARGTVGESILIEIERNGNPVQLTIPRGPIGVTSGRGFFGR